MRMRKTFTLLVLAAALVPAAAQPSFKQNEPQIFSPDAYEMCRYGRTPVNYFNGLPEISVPLTEVRAKGCTLPVYLTYHASGNKPDHHPGWVGEGWSLHAGGAVTRIIRGQRDEMDATEYGYLYGATPTYNPGYF